VNIEHGGKIVRIDGIVRRILGDVFHGYLQRARVTVPST
jgi:hypothetical protein